MNTNETIGTCELCGLTDHHLVAGECPRCRKKICEIAELSPDVKHALGRLSRHLFEWLHDVDFTVPHACDGVNSKPIQAVAVLDPADMPIILADEDLEYWGRWFVDNHFEKRGVNFETFMTDPFAIAQALLFGLPMPLPKGEEFYPLLPRQREVAAGMHPRVRAISRPLPESHDALIRAGFTPTLPGVSVTAELPVFLRKQAD